VPQVDVATSATKEVPGDLVVTRLVGGPPRALEIYLQMVHSQVV